MSTHFPYGVGVEPCAPAGGRRYPPRKRLLCAWSWLGRGTKRPPPCRAPRGRGLKCCPRPPPTEGADDLQVVGAVGGGVGESLEILGGRAAGGARPEESYMCQPSGHTDSCISGRAGGGRFQESGKEVQSQEWGGVKMSIFPPSLLRGRRPRPHQRPRPQRVGAASPDWASQAPPHRKAAFRVWDRGAAGGTTPTPERGPCLCLRPHLRLFSPSRSQAKARSGKLHTSFSRGNQVASPPSAGKVLQASDVSDAGRRPHCLGFLIGWL